MDTHLKIGDVAKRSGVSVSSLHFYERKGLIQSYRNAGNQRIYSRSILRRVAIIKVAQQLGMPLKEIKEAISILPMNKSASSDDWKQLSSFWKEQLDERIHKLIQLRDELSNCIGCGCLSMSACALRNPEDKVADSGSGAIFLK